MRRSEELENQRMVQAVHDQVTARPRAWLEAELVRLGAEVARLQELDSAAAAWVAAHDGCEAVFKQRDAMARLRAALGSAKRPRAPSIPRV